MEDAAVMPKAMPPIRPTVPEVSLLTAANSLGDDAVVADALHSGLSFTDYFCLEAFGWPRCPDEETLNTGMEQQSDVDDCPDFLPWTYYVPIEDNRKVTYTEAFRAARTAFDVRKPGSVARELWTGALSGSASLQSTAVDVTPSGGATSALNGAAALLGNFRDAAGAGQAFLHVPEVLIPQLVRDMFCERVGNRLLTPLGDVVVPGPGYPQNAGAWGPEGSDGPLEATEDEAFMYVTGPVELGFGPESDLSSGAEPDSSFARMNRAALVIEQEVIFRFPTCAVFGVLVNKAG